MIATGNELPVRVEKSTSKITPLSNHRRIGDLRQGRAHLVHHPVNERRNTANVVGSISSGVDEVAAVWLMFLRSMLLAMMSPSSPEYGDLLSLLRPYE